MLDSVFNGTLYSETKSTKSIDSPENSGKLTSMKQTLTRRMKYKTRVMDIRFEYWPAIPDSRTQPGEGPEINILEMKGVDGELYPIPTIVDDGGDGEYEDIVGALLYILTEEQYR